MFHPKMARLRRRSHAALVLAPTKVDILSVTSVRCNTTEDGLCSFAGASVPQQCHEDEITITHLSGPRTGWIDAFH
jgi:hypothetical protein